MSQKQVRIPTHEPLPRWYSLELKSHRTLVVRVHAKAAAYVRALNYAEGSLIPELIRKFGFEDFIPPTASEWGFGRQTLWGPEAPLRVGRSKYPAWVSWECLLPRYHQEHEETDHRKLMAVRASLAMLFEGLALFGYTESTDQSAPQLMTIQLRLDYGLHGGSLWATLTPAMISYLQQLPDQSELTEVVVAMRRATHRMFGRPRYDDAREFRARCTQPKWINLAVPGNACGLDPSDRYDPSSAVGYSLCPHNVDSSFQQLGLLAGLAKLHQLAAASL